MKLTKEECIKALDCLADDDKMDELAQKFSMDDDYTSHVNYEMARKWCYDQLKQCIEEHFDKNTLVKCEKCGKEMPYLLVEMFNRDGSDSFLRYSYNRIEGYVSIVTGRNWTGYELSEEEMLETIVCPHCGKHPFQSKEIHVYDEVEIVMFPKENKNVD